MVGEGRPPPGKRVPMKGFRAVSDERPSEKSAPESLLLVPNKRNWKVFGRYFFFSLLLLLIGYAARPWGLILVWPAVSLGIVATGYLGVGSAIFRKHQGRLPWPARTILGPYLLGAFLSFLYYRRGGPLYNEVIPGVFIGCALSAREAKEVKEKGVRAVLDLTAEYSENSRFLQLAYQNIQILGSAFLVQGRQENVFDLLKLWIHGSKPPVRATSRAGWRSWPTLARTPRRRDGGQGGEKGAAFWSRTQGTSWRIYLAITEGRSWRR